MIEAWFDLAAFISLNAVCGCLLIGIDGIKEKQ